MQEPPPPQPPPENISGEPTQPLGQPPPSYAEPTQPIGQPPPSYAEPTQPIGQPPISPSDTLVPPAQPAPQAPEGEYRQPTQGQEPPPQQAPGDSFAQLPQPSPSGVSPGRAHWVTFSRLRGHPLIDISEGKTIGTVHDLLLDQQRRAIQAFLTKGGLFHKASLVPALRATIGADAITFQPGALAGQDTSWLDELPKASQVLGMRVHSNTGQLLGTVEELRIDPASAALVALELAPAQTGIPHRLGTARRLLAANSVISYGSDTIVALEEGVSEL
jgi:uncharacterized protein YrrD